MASHSSARALSDVSRNLDDEQLLAVAANVNAEMAEARRQATERVDGGGGVEGWDDASETFNVTIELVRRGYSEEEIGMLWSGNLLRVLDEVQAIAAGIRAGGG
jgi:microsomal dipeptidase-like Zn-dependent dipeptidase